MAERRKLRKRRDDVPNPEKDGQVDKPSKEEYAVAKWIRNNVPSKKTKFDRNHMVEYFTGTRAVDALLDNSPWNKSLFETREQVTDFLDTMLRHKFFHRAKKVVITEEELCKLRGIKKKLLNKDPSKDDNKLDKTATKEKDTADETKEKEETAAAEEKQEQQEGKSKKKPKVRLEMHMEQYFADCNDAYVWIYEPIPVYYWFFGTLLVLGAIGVCLFPLWPLTIRHGVWYLSVAAAGFLVFILALALLRVVVFSLLWVITLGRHHLWLLPNLAEDVGFFASFWPLYQYEYCGPSSDKKSKKKKRKKDKDSDDEDTPLAQSSETTGELKGEKTSDEGSTEKLGKNGEGDGNNSESSESEKSNTGRDFEMVQHTELDEK